MTYKWRTWENDRQTDRQTDRTVGVWRGFGLRFFVVWGFCHYVGWLGVARGGYVGGV